MGWSNWTIAAIHNNLLPASSSFSEGYCNLLETESTTELHSHRFLWHRDDWDNITCLQTEMDTTRCGVYKMDYGNGSVFHAAIIMRPKPKQKSPFTTGIRIRVHLRWVHMQIP
ncbi:hypothetical protein FGIG_01500 [Fasciola gigantica]|uniref:Uncharacterized protein n=1 Tax=Fasciola gigantica TaxID=46835 RepID=A0A504YE59_FASGI|nr:hypothetical protein FGIG_01500 [Fasciola gigantica]